MCKKLMFLISLVLLISWGAVASADDLEVPEGTTYTVSGTEDYEEVWVEGTLIVPTGQTITSDNGNSGINGGTILVDGGTYISNARFNIGDGDGGDLIITGGGSFTQQCDGDDCEDGFKLPDNEGGSSRITISDGTFTAYCIEMRPERDGRIELGPDATMYLTDKIDDEDDNERYDPCEWLDNDWMYGIEGIAKEDITIEKDGDTATITTPAGCDPLKATNPSPADGGVGVASVVSDVELEWAAACGIGGAGRHYVFFSTDKDCVDNAPSYSIGWTPPDCYLGYRNADNPTWNVGNKPLWIMHYWRVDQKLESTGQMVKGDTWRFTTGCDPVPAGDVNLDCLVNFDDFALMLTTFGEEQFFPWD